MRRFEYKDQKSNKFWEIEREGSSVTTRWGKIDTSGQTKTKDLGTDAKAEAHVDKQIASKVKKGYAEVGEGLPPVEVKATGGAKSATSAKTGDGPQDLADGEETQVPGSGSRSYTLKNVGGVYSCTCPAWRNQSVPIERRTCKHLRRFRGEAAETERLGSLPARAVSTRGAKEGAPKVLLAESFDPDVHDPSGWWMSEKLDGVRAWWDGKRFISRQGNEYFAPEWFTEGLPDHPLDGELFGGRGEFQRTVSIARRADRSKEWSELSYVIFDGPELGGPFENRLAQLSELVEAHAWKHAKVLEHTLCDGLDALKRELARIEALGGEGLMLRKPASTYVHGRSESLLKVKSFFDAEARVIGHEAGRGKHKGRLGALRVVLKEGTEFKVGTGFSDAERADPPPIGAIVTFRYQELTKAGVPRFPTYVGVRHDHDWE
ncbi:MAG: DNA ligase [Deltaproteobacteria bacterium]|nr:DNA ligase [Deltaproteobacteria bacterium]